MRSLPSAITLGLLLASTLVFAAGTTDFEVRFPEKPKHETVDQVLNLASGQQATLSVQRLSVERDTGIYVVTYFDLPEALLKDAEAASPKAKPAEVRAKVAADFVKQTINGVAQSLGGRVEKTVRTRRDDGGEDVAFGGPLIGPDKKTRIGVFESRAILVPVKGTGRYSLYTVLSAVAPTEDDRKRAEAFVQSFTLRNAKSRAPGKDARP